MIAGRSCPLNYRYPPSLFREVPIEQASTLYAVGGVYGNPEALATVLDLKRHEERTGPPVTLVFASLGCLPKVRTFEIGRTRVGILHGDPESLAGWGLSREALVPELTADAPGVATPKRVLARWFTEANVRVYLSSHTCLPVMRELDVAGRRCLVANNGAAGMPNFQGTRWGLITRASTSPAVSSWSLYGSRVGALHVDALPLHYNHLRWMERFLASWPEGSPAHRGYHHRIDSGTELAAERAKTLLSRRTPTHRP